MSDRSSGGAADSTRTEALRALHWLRERHPDAQMSVKVIPSEEAFVAVRVRFQLSDGPSSSAHGVAMAIEEAENRGIVRALEALGYQRQARVAVDAASPDERVVPAVEPDEPSAEAPEQATEPAPPDVPARPAPSPHPAAEPTVRAPVQQPAPLAGRAAQMGPPVMVRPRQQQPAQQRPAQGQGRGGLRPVPDLPETDARLEDVSWTEFWKWARARGFDSRDAVNDAIGRPMDGMTPRQVRDVIKAYLGEEE
jgi:hypothetical protein